MTAMVGLREIVVLSSCAGVESDASRAERRD